MKSNLLILISMLLMSIVSQTTKGQTFNPATFTPARFTPSTFTPMRGPSLSIVKVIGDNNNGGGISPTSGIVLEREVPVAYIENETFNNVSIELRAYDYRGVKVIVRDATTKKKIYKKKLYSYLYCFPNGAIQVGIGDALTQISILKNNDTNMWWAQIKEKGIY